MGRWRGRFAVSLIGCSSSAATSSDATGAQDAVDSPSADSSAPLCSPTDRTSSCTTLACGAGSTIVAWAAAVPPATVHGVIPDGLYMLTRKIYYVGPHGTVNPAHLRDATWLRIRGTTWDVSKVDSGALTAEQLRSSVEASPYITLTPVCGDPVFPGTPTVDFSVLSSQGTTQLDIYWAGASIIVDSYVKQ